MRTIKHFNEHMKVRVCHHDKSRLKHEVIKTICVMLIKNKYKFKAKKIYTEYPVDKRIADVYFELGKERYVIEIQKNMVGNYLKNTELYYLDRDVTPIVIKLNKISEDIQEMWGELKKLL